MPWMTKQHKPKDKAKAVASMRPRLIAVDDYDGILWNDNLNKASMRPRLIAVDDIQYRQLHHSRQERASMRPRLIAVDDAVGVRGAGGGKMLQ